MTDDITIIQGFIPKDATKGIFDRLLSTINWQNELVIAGTDQKTKIHRKMSYVTDKTVTYAYANLQLQGETWTPELLEIRDKVQARLGIDFNSVLLNLYEDGKDEIKWHSDKEKQLGDNPVIACVNLGATRNFWFLEKSTGMKSARAVADGDLLIMGGNCQRNYLHAILKEKKVTEPRMSLTFRWVYE